MAIDNVLVKGVKVTLDRERIFSFPMKALAYLAGIYGTVPKALDKFSELNPNKIIKVKDSNGDEQEKLIPNELYLSKEMLDIMMEFVTAALLADDPTITKEEVEIIIDFNNIAQVMKALSEALVAWLPKVERAKEGSKNPQKRSN